jgi:MFS transporter, PHS family, inorganic phosphate transporter
VRARVFDLIDAGSFDWQLVRATGSGVFAASYSFFVPYMIIPALNFIYWPNASSLDENYQVHLVALAGTIIGALLAGPIADIYGRRQLYRLGPLLLLVGAVGLAGASAGFNNSTMSVFGWIIFWQILIGIGVGVEWTVSGVISAEYSLSVLVDVELTDISQVSTQKTLQ